MFYTELAHGLTHFVAKSHAVFISSMGASILGQDNQLYKIGLFWPYACHIYFPQ